MRVYYAVNEPSPFETIQDIDIFVNPLAVELEDSEISKYLNIVKNILKK